MPKRILVGHADHMFTIYVLVLGIIGSPARAYPPELQHQVADYHQCLRVEAGAECTKKYYSPIFKYCQDRPLECAALLGHADPGALSFKKCAALDSCTFGGAQAPDYFLRTSLKPGEEKAEVRDSYLAPYQRFLRLKLQMRIPAETLLTTENQSIVLVQWHAVNDHSPPFALRLKGDDTVVLTVRHNTIDDEPVENGTEVIVKSWKIVRDHWYEMDFVVRAGEDGFLSFTADGQTVADYRGPLGYKNKANYFKFGPYDYTLTQTTPFEIQFRGFERSI